METISKCRPDEGGFFACRELRAFDMLIFVDNAVLFVGFLLKKNALDAVRNGHCSRLAAISRRYSMCPI